MMYRHACLDALDNGCIKSSVHSPDRQVPSTMVNHYLGYQRIIEWRHEQAGERCRIDTHSRPSREVDPGYQSGRWREGPRRLRVDSTLDRMAVESNV